MPKRYLVTPKDGRVKKVLPDGRRVLVAIPGQLIDYELAVELGLVKSEPTPEPQQEEPPKPAPQKRAAKKSAPAKPAEPSEPEPAPKFSSYPTKKSSGK